MFLEIGNGGLIVKESKIYGNNLYYKKVYLDEIIPNRNRPTRQRRLIYRDKSYIRK